MKIYKTKRFQKFADEQHISDQTLLEAIFNAEQGLIDANLGGGVIKLRIARQGQGKSTGYRTIVYYQAHDIAIFAFGFAKNALANISPEESRAFKDTAKNLLKLPPEALNKYVADGKLIPILLNS